MFESFKRSVHDRVMHHSRHNPISISQISHVRALDQLSETTLQELAKARACEMARHAAERSALYKELYKDIPSQFGSTQFYNSLPIITKCDIRHKEKDIATRSLRFMVKGLTSGTTGASLSVYRTPMAIMNEYAYVWYYRMSHGIKKGDPIVSLRAKLKRDQLFYFNRAENILYISPFLLSQDNIGTIATILSDFKPKALFSYPSFMCNLAHLLKLKGYHLTIPLLFTSSETLYAHNRMKLEEYFHARIYDWYGNVERTIAIGECEYGNYHEMPLYSFNEYKEDGIITTGLINKSYPLIRYWVEDRIEKINDTCKCGKQHVIRSIEGRINDSLALKNGTFVSGLSVGYAFINVKNIRLAQIVQKDQNHIEVNVVGENGFCSDNRDELMKNLRERLPDDLSMNFNQVEEDSITKAKSGKFKLVISDFS